MYVLLAKAPDPKILYPPNIVGKYEQEVVAVKGEADQPNGMASLAFKYSSNMKDNYCYYFLFSKIGSYWFFF